MKKNDRRAHPDPICSDRGVECSGRNCPGGPDPKAVRKGNPGILDWVVDAELGLFSPLTSIFLKAIDPTGLLPELWPSKEEVLAVKRYLTEGLPSFSPVAPPYTPEGVYGERLKSAKAEQKQMADLTLLSVVLEGLPFTDTGTAFMGLYRCPKYASDVRRALEVYYSEFQTGELPFIQRYWNKQYLPNLPGYQDMIGIYVREGYLEEKWVEIPPEFLEFMKELGYSEAWTNRLWGKHWVLPGVNLLYEMFHKKIITYDVMVQMLKYHDFEPVWRDRLIANAWSLIPRVDLRRGYAWGIISGEELQTRYERLGFNPEDAVAMTGIAKRYGLTAYYSRLLTVASATFRKGQLSGQDFQRIMEVCGLPGEAQDLLLRAEAMARDAAVTELGEEPRTLSASQVCAAYTKGLLSLSAAKDQLLRMGYLEGDADLLLQLAAPKPSADQPATEIVSAASLLYRQGWMSPEEFTGWLQKAGLNADEIAVTKDAQDLRYWFDYASDLLTLWKQMYAKDLITLDEFYQSLVRWGCQPDRAWAIVSLEETRKIPKPRVGA